MKPNEKAPFLYHPGDVDGIIKSVDIEVVDARATTKQEYAGIDVINHNGSYNSLLRSYSVTGQIKNNGDQQKENVFLFATFYDSAGEVVGVGETSIDSSDIGVGQTADFDISTDDSNCDVANIVSYALTVVAYS